MKNKKTKITCDGRVLINGVVTDEPQWFGHKEGPANYHWGKQSNCSICRAKNAS